MPAPSGSDADAWLSIHRVGRATHCPWLVEALASMTFPLALPADQMESFSEDGFVITDNLVIRGELARSGAALDA